VLHVTNGDSAAASLRAAGLTGDVLPWRDALHEGPVPAGLDPAALRAERARFMAARGWAQEQEASADMAARDERLDRALQADEHVVLWFETDLYDVLQLAQITDRLQHHRAALVLVGVDRFRGVAELTTSELRAQEPIPLDPAPLRALWDAFRAPDPGPLAELAAPPYVRDAARRHLQQFPWRSDGLNRTERALLHALAAGARTPAEAFVAAQRQEERPFLGDAIAFEYLAALPRGETARAILAGEARWTARPERWLGGVHLPAGESPWLYEPAAAAVVPG
jgi:hypothetical protein